MRRIKHIMIGLLLITGLSAEGQGSGNDFEIYKNLELFSLVYKTVDLNYVDEPIPGHLMKTAIDAMLYELDPYTTYIPESLMEDFKLMTTGLYGGIGATIQEINGNVIIADPFEGFPAQKTGLMAGDIFIEINGKNVENLHSSEISDKLKGKPGSELFIKIKRDGKLVEKTLIREEVKIKSVPYYGIVSDNIGYIKLSSFTRDAYKDTFEAFEDLKKNQGMEKLIFDLRGNPGGLLMEAVKIVNLWVVVKEIIPEKIDGTNKNDHTNENI